MSKDRDSNIELLRLVCMFMILLIHFTGHCIMECSEMFKQQSGIAILIPNLLHGLCWCAVNTFIIISGYYGIRPKAKSFFNLYLQCAFYAGVLYLLHLYITDTHVNRWCIYNTIMPFSYNPNWWFIPQYVILYILSPILNKVVETTNKRQFVLFLLLMAIVVFYFGHYRQKMLPFLEGGFNFINFIINVFNKRPSDGKNLNGMSPDELFNQEYKEKTAPTHEALKFFILLVVTLLYIITLHLMYIYNEYIILEDTYARVC